MSALDFTSNSRTVYGTIDEQCLGEIDQIAEQMMMPRSWVVSQIIKEWCERRQAELRQEVSEQSWEDSYSEVIGRLSSDQNQPQALSA